MEFSLTTSAGAFNYQSMFIIGIAIIAIIVVLYYIYITVSSETSDSSIIDKDWNNDKLEEAVDSLND